MFISSTAIFIVFFYFALREYRTGELFYAAMSGLACGFCYLTYYSSYLAFPVLLAFVAVAFLRARRFLVLQNFAVALAGMLLVLAPFAAYGLRYGNYVATRPNQVSLLTGTWSPHREEIARGANPLPIIRDNLVLVSKSFVTNGMGGSQGFDMIGKLKDLEQVVRLQPLQALGERAPGNLERPAVHAAGGVDDEDHLARRPRDVR